MSSTGEASPSGWFGPLTPLSPIAPPEVAGRQMDFPSGYNIVSGARAYEPIGFQDLRALAETYDLLRLVIETRKDQVERMSWWLAPAPRRERPGLRAHKPAHARFSSGPTANIASPIWLRMLLEDLFVIDAPTLWRQRARNGESGRAASARRRDDQARDRRLGPHAAALFRQWRAGPSRRLSANSERLSGGRLRRARHHLRAAQSARQSRLWPLAGRADRDDREHRAKAPDVHAVAFHRRQHPREPDRRAREAWTPDQIKNFQDYWDAYFTGDLAARRRAKFVPGGVAKTFIQTKEPELKSVFDEWLARIVCYAFSVSHQAFVNAYQSLDRRNAKGDGRGRGAVAGFKVGQAADRRRV